MQEESGNGTLGPDEPPQGEYQYPTGPRGGNLFVREAAALEDAFIARYTGYVRRIGRTASYDVLLRALSTSDDVNGLALALESAGRPAASAADPLAGARLRSARARQELLERAGGAYQAGEVAAMLGVTRQAVHGRYKRGSILGLPQGETEILYPACQFTREGQVVAGLGEVLAAFGVQNPWTQLAVLMAPSAAAGGNTPLQSLAAGDRQGALMAVRGYGEHVA
ncbi:MAG TPA: hypothetical protein VFH27_13230 [Longimicrobiaceae bacterium]|nr:hypothetical protein [Longimicrobiaceae bacterium]